MGICVHQRPHSVSISFGRENSKVKDRFIQAQMITPAERMSKIWSVVRVSSGNFLEMYDFMVFGYYAATIGKAFFPSNSAFGSLMLSLLTFGAAFLIRPLPAHPPPPPTPPHHPP